ncbi:hypothetical protein MNBD_GAMMA04-777 [hydrothermal vent metagenome]|uniref:HTH cro/C1-type domain-containing protein n=1 Tax=hydrothermal vent metagenome TaxID=652676 RepID=A0A3B0WW63_9ZZZZ
MMTEDVSKNVVSLGTLLLTTREAQGLSLEHVASRLNLSLAQLVKLESRALDPAQLSTFERGYVRNYTNFLQIDTALIDHYFVGCEYAYSDLHSVKKYGCTTHKPLLGRGIVKWLLVFALFGLLALLFYLTFENF